MPIDIRDSYFFIIVLSLACFQPTLVHSQENPFVGTWELVSVQAISGDGSVDAAPYGDAPHGYITYTADGYMTVLFSFRDRPNINGTWRSAPESDRAKAFATVLGYAGTYSVEGQTMTHHITVSTDPNRVGTSVSRIFEIGNGTVTLTTPAIALEETAKRYSLKWKRAQRNTNFLNLSSIQ
jgi:hypothetical protein